MVPAPLPCGGRRMNAREHPGRGGDVRPSAWAIADPVGHCMLVFAFVPVLAAVPGWLLREASLAPAPHRTYTVRSPPLVPIANPGSSHS